MIKAHELDSAHNAHNMCNMKNLTLRIDEQVLDRARRVALDQGTTVNALVRDYLSEYALTHDKRAEARRRIVELCRQSKASSAGVKWKREDIYDRFKLR